MNESGPVKNGAPAPATPVTMGDTVPQTWPGAFGLLKFSKNAMRYVLVPYIILMLISVVVSVAGSLLGGSSPEPGKEGMYWGVQLVEFFASMLLSIAAIWIELRGVDKKPATVGESLSQSLPLLVRFLVLMIIMGTVFFASILLLFIPFIFVLPRLVLAPYYLVDKNMGIMEAFNASWAAGKNLLGKTWGIVGASMVFALPILTLVGIPVSIYLFVMYSAAWAILYRWHLTQK